MYVNVNVKQESTSDTFYNMIIFMRTFSLFSPFFENKNYFVCAFIICLSFPQRHRAGNLTSSYRMIVQTVKFPATVTLWCPHGKSQLSADRIIRKVQLFKNIFQPKYLKQNTGSGNIFFFKFCCYFWEYFISRIKFNHSD